MKATITNQAIKTDQTDTTRKTNTTTKTSANDDADERRPPDDIHFGHIVDMASADAMEDPLWSRALAPEHRRSLPLPTEEKDGAQGRSCRPRGAPARWRPVH